MPVYNAEKHLGETLGYVCSQTLQNIEIICVDDGSTDASRAIMQEYAAKDPRLHILSQQNQYAGVARNNGMAVAKGKYLIFLDSDDIFVPDMLEKLYNRAEETAADIVCCGGSNYNEASQRVLTAKWILPGLKTEGVSPHAFYPLQETPGEIFTYSSVVPWNKLFRRAFIQENGIRWFHSRSSNDLTFICHCMAVAKKVSLLHEPLMQYRTRQDSLWHSNSKPPRDIYDAHVELLRRMRNLNMPRTVIMGVYQHLLHDLSMHLAPNDAARAAERAAILKDEYEPVFRLMETDLGALEHTETYTRLQAFMAPSASVIVSLTKPCRHLEECLNTALPCPAEIIIDISHADAEAAKQAANLAQRFFWIRTSAEEVQVRSSCTLHLTIDQFCANYCNLKQLLNGDQGKAANNCLKYIYNRLFYVSTQRKQSWRFFGLPLVTIKYGENCRTTKILGILRFKRKYRL